MTDTSNFQVGERVYICSEQLMLWCQATVKECREHQHYRYVVLLDDDNALMPVHGHEIRPVLSALIARKAHESANSGWKVIDDGHCEA